MPTWIIDDGPFDLLAKVVDVNGLDAWPLGQFLVAQATADAAVERRKALLDAHPTPFVPFNVLDSSRAVEILFLHLRQPSKSTANLAEHESIAWAIAERPDSIFVVFDKRAVVLALRQSRTGNQAQHQPQR